MTSQESGQRAPIVPKPAAFNLEIAGSIGNFAVKTEHGSSVPVKYIQTHIKFSLEDAQQQRLFECLKPVREIFNYKDLGFEDLMQRDIDDARVSTSLIPYLLLPATGDTVKFFPPIVTVVVPVSGEMKLQPKYAEIKSSVEEQQDYKIHHQVSGTPGYETFKFEQLEVNGELNPYDNARLKLNTNKCQLVIVDGQHRAMALLALYRNLKKWPDDSKAFEDYYRRWGSDVVKQNLADISLPMVICTFPSLDEKCELDQTVPKACRAIFLALNKNARPVSASRNILLDDDDFIAHCERAVLTHFKDQPDDSPYSLRLCNFELDADEDKQSLKSTVAISGIMHLYSVLERVMLSTDPPTGLHYPARRYDKMKPSKFQQSCLRRLDAANLIGEEITKATTRNSVTAETRKALKKSFEDRYGKYIVRGFAEFFPYQAAGKASLWLQRQVDQKADRQPQKMLFEGQGIQRVFTSYISLLGAELAEKYPNKHNIPPYLDTVMEDFKKAEQRLKEYQVQFYKTRTEEMLPAKLVSKINQAVYDAVDQLFKNVLTTTAFQNALFVTFFSTLEKLNGDQDKLVTGDEKDDALFAEYMAALNNFFNPSKEEELFRLLSTFSGKVSGELGDGSFKVVRNNNNLRGILFRGTELKPDEWDKFRYMLLEIWKKHKTENEALKELLEQYVQKCRIEVLQAFGSRQMNHYCQEKGIEVTEVPTEEKERLKKECLELYIQALHETIGKLPKAEIKQLEDVKLFVGTDAEESAEEEGDLGD